MLPERIVVLNRTLWITAQKHKFRTLFSDLDQAVFPSAALPGAVTRCGVAACFYRKPCRCKYNLISRLAEKLTLCLKNVCWSYKANGGLKSSSFNTVDALVVFLFLYIVCNLQNICS